MQILRSLIRLLGGFALIVALAGCGGRTASLDGFPSVAENRYVLGAGDKLQIYVYGLEAFKNATFIVADDGTLSLPLMDKVPAAGKTVGELEATIKSTLADQQILKNPLVNVQPAGLRPYYILGEVNKPGEYEYTPGMTVLAAVSKAGGFTMRANEKRVSISRAVKGKTVVGKADMDDLVGPGDQIRVLERWF